jgi:hypothetical protein
VGCDDREGEPEEDGGGEEAVVYEEAVEGIER